MRDLDVLIESVRLGKKLGAQGVNLFRSQVPPSGSRAGIVATAVSPHARAQHATGNSVEALQQEWSYNQELRAEFRDSFERYVAYMKAEQNRQARIFAPARKGA